jgi:hypothetical protein
MDRRPRKTEERSRTLIMHTWMEAGPLGPLPIPQGVVSKTLYDGMGHATRTLLSSDPQGVDIVDTVTMAWEKWRAFRTLIEAQRQGLLTMPMMH